jgi:D-amino-acid dehydrogenase
LTLKAPDVMPQFPTVHAEDRFVATPMAVGLRLTGVVELAGVSAPPNWRRAHALLPLARRLYPGLAAEGERSVWMGHRPSLPDSLPVIGRSTRSADVIYAFGHGHLGLTGAPFTGQLVAELVAGRPTAIDVAPFAPERFRRA